MLDYCTDFGWREIPQQIFNTIWERQRGTERQVNQLVSRLMVHAGCVCKGALGDAQVISALNFTRSRHFAMGGVNWMGLKKKRWMSDMDEGLSP